MRDDLEGHSKTAYVFTDPPDGTVESLPEKGLGRFVSGTVDYPSS